MILLAIGVTIPDEHTTYTSSAIDTAGVDLVLIHPTLRGVLRFGTIDQTMKATRIVDGGNYVVCGGWWVGDGEKGEGRCFSPSLSNRSSSIHLVPSKEAIA